MQRIITVKLADVFPLEDEFGNQYASRDYSTKANQQYVRELAESMRMKGIPDEPIAVVEDGGIYRIKTGNSRVMAMRELGTRECPAIIDDEDTVQSVIEAVVRTDTKKKYEDVEKSRFVQQLVMFGDDQYVSDVSGIEVEKVKRIRKARMVVDDAGDDMTLDRMIALADFADDKEAVKQLTNCTEREFPAILDKLQAEKEKRERSATVVASLESRGVKMADDVSGMKIVTTVQNASQIPADLPEGAVATPHQVPGFFAIYAPTSEEVNDEVERQAALREANAKRHEAASERRGEWLAAQIRRWDDLGAKRPAHMCALVTDDPHRFGTTVSSISGFVKEHGIDVPVGPSEVIGKFIALDTSTYGIYNYANNPVAENCKKLTALLDAMMADGYEASDEEIETYNAAADHIGGGAND